MEKKRELFRFRAYDYEGIEKHLEEMAAEGWMLVSTGNYFWTYEKCEPRKLRFSLQYREDGGSIFAYSSGEQSSEQAAREDAAKKGWSYIDIWSNVRVFCSECEGTVPIYEDEKEKVEGCRKVMNKTYLGALSILLLIDIFVGWKVIGDIIKYPLNALSGYAQIIAAAAVLLAFLTLAGNLVSLIIWLNKAENGQIPKVRTGNYIILDTLQYIFLFIAIICFTISLSREGGAVEAGGVVIWFLMFALISFFFSKLKKKRIGTAGWIGVILAAVVLFVIVDMGYLNLADNADSPDVIPDYAVTYEDLTGEAIQRDDCSTYREAESVFLKKIELDEYDEKNRYLCYYIAEIKNEKQYEWFFNKAMMEEIYYWRSVVPGGLAPDEYWKEQKDAAWGVDKVYKTGDEWLLGKDNLIIYIWLDSKPTDKQKADIVKKLEEAIDEA